MRAIAQYSILMLPCWFALGVASTAQGAFTEYRRTMDAIVTPGFPEHDLIDPAPITSPDAQTFTGTVSNSGGDLQSSATLNGSVGFGSIHAVVQAHSSDNALSIGGATSAASAIGADWSDTIPLRSTTLADGTPVEVRLGFLFEGAITGDVGYSVGTFPNGHVMFSGWGSEIQFDTPSQAGPFLFSTTVTIDSAVGDDINLRGSLSLYTGSRVDRRSPPDLGPSSVTTTVDALNTAALSLEILTPGVTYQSESGTVYATSLPVPEPGTMALVTAGILCLAMRLASPRARHA